MEKETRREMKEEKKKPSNLKTPTQLLEKPGGGH